MTHVAVIKEFLSEPGGHGDQLIAVVSIHALEQSARAKVWSMISIAEMVHGDKSGPRETPMFFEDWADQLREIPWTFDGRSLYYYTITLTEVL
jgi:hypothetical protein